MKLERDMGRFVFGAVPAPGNRLSLPRIWAFQCSVAVSQVLSCDIPVTHFRCASRKLAVFHPPQTVT